MVALVVVLVVAPVVVLVVVDLVAAEGADRPPARPTIPRLVGVMPPFVVAVAAPSLLPSVVAAQPSCSLPLGL